MQVDSYPAEMKDVRAKEGETAISAASLEASTATSPEASIRTDDDVVNFKPGMWLYMTIATLSILTFIVALDATCLAVALPVCLKQC